MRFRDRLDLRGEDNRSEPRSEAASGPEKLKETANIDRTDTGNRETPAVVQQRLQADDSIAMLSPSLLKASKPRFLKVKK